MGWNEQGMAARGCDFSQQVLASEVDIVIGAVTLNPERDSVIAGALGADGNKRIVA